MAAIIMSLSASSFFLLSSCSAALSCPIMASTSPSSRPASCSAASASSLVRAEP